jgi:transaldolase/glucose-6-phosphate isomerase
MTPAQSFDGDDSLGPLAVAVRRRLALMKEQDLLGRIWRRDYTVWKPDPTEISNRLGWLTVGSDMRVRVPELQDFARTAAAEGFTRALLLGMGGSSLAPDMFARTFGTASGALELTVLDTTHPVTITRVEQSLDLDHTLFIVASKSGGTLETISHFEHFYSRVPDGSRFIAITDPGTSLEALARSKGFRRVFSNPPDIGGRYSALSLFGLVPAALIGVDLDALLASACEEAHADEPTPDPAQSPGGRLGAVMGEAALAGRDKLTFVIPAGVAAFGDWVEQLVAESTGKEGKGIVPVPGEPLGPPEVYGPDRLFVALGPMQAHPGLEALQGAGHPVVTLDFAGPAELGAQLFRFELATAVACSILGINAFDQPNVEAAKQATRDILAQGALGSPEPGDARAMLAGVSPGDYIGVQAYLDHSSQEAAMLQQRRLRFRDDHLVATTVGFGPRFLHSTGQLHKGGPNSGVFLQATDAPRDVDVPIPGQPFTFGTLIDAQALGDLQALRAQGRRVARISPAELQDLA